MSCFGARPGVMAKLWTFIDPAETMSNGAEPKHMTWAFYCMKQYLTEDVTAINVGLFDEKTHENRFGFLLKPYCTKSIKW
jgi:hypothetical protein